MSTKRPSGPPKNPLVVCTDSYVKVKVVTSVITIAGVVTYLLVGGVTFITHRVHIHVYWMSHLCNNMRRLNISQGLRLSMMGHLYLDQHPPIILTLALHIFNYCGHCQQAAHQQHLWSIHQLWLFYVRYYGEDEHAQPSAWCENRLGLLSPLDMRILDDIYTIHCCNSITLPRSNHPIWSSGPNYKENTIKYKLSNFLKIQKSTQFFWIFLNIRLTLSNFSSTDFLENFGMSVCIFSGYFENSIKISGFSK